MNAYREAADRAPDAQPAKREPCWLWHSWRLRGIFTCAGLDAAEAAKKGTARQLAQVAIHVCADCGARKAYLRSGYYDEDNNKRLTGDSPYIPKAEQWEGQ